MRRSQLLFSAPPGRILIEASLMTSVIGGLFLLIMHFLRVGIPANQIIFIAGLLGAGWCALRLSRIQGPWWRRRLREIVVMVVLSVLEGIVVAEVNRVGIPFFAHSPVVIRDILVPSVEAAGISLLLFVGNFCVFLVVRAAFVIWKTWNQLRRTQLQWSLTHAHAMVVVFGTGLFMVMAAVVLAFFAHGNFVRLIIPIVVIVLVIGVMSILAIIPPSALFSYVVVRGTVQRLQMLTVATSALRAGNYGVRVPVVGEDEVAQLQTDFNAMATDLERVMRELQRERDIVAGLLQSRRELVANASHELRTPVATLRGYLETTLTHWNERAEPHVQQDLLVMEHEVLHLQTLVEDLFALARADVGRLSSRYEPTDLGALVQRLVEVRAPLAWQASKIEVIADLQRGLPEVLVDATRVEQILQNLLHAAVRSTAPGGIVIVSGQREGRQQGEKWERVERLVIQIKNTDLVAENLLFAGETSESRMQVEQGAMGLGLLLVKEWTEEMGGQIWEENLVGEGHCWSVSFPASIADKARSESLFEERAAVSS